MALSLAKIVDNVSSPELIPIYSGILAFYSTLAVSTTLQQKILRISTGSIRPLPTIVGIASVAAASIVSHYAAVNAKERIRSQTITRYQWRGLRRHDDEEDAILRAVHASEGWSIQTLKMYVAMTKSHKEASFCMSFNLVLTRTRTWTLI
jgi:hypothetical protein